ncbi:MAG: hypothetical protein IID37_05870 [Planctomycetes bacterium]|nr:hypothetical protein [Planctomycetota bacterium]
MRAVTCSSLTIVVSRFGSPAGSGDPYCDAADLNGERLVDPLDTGFVLARSGECP